MPRTKLIITGSFQEFQNWVRNKRLSDSTDTTDYLYPNNIQEAQGLQRDTTVFYTGNYKAHPIMQNPDSLTILKDRFLVHEYDNRGKEYIQRTDPDDSKLMDRPANFRFGRPGGA